MELGDDIFTRKDVPYHVGINEAKHARTGLMFAHGFNSEMILWKCVYITFKIASRFHFSEYLLKASIYSNM